MNPSSATPSQPWWRHGQVWMLIAGPVLVVLASFYTFYLAVRTPDPVVDADYYRKGLEINKTLGASEVNSMAPALQARNHAQTGVAPAQPAPTTDKRP